MTNEGHFAILYMGAERNILLSKSNIAQGVMKALSHSKACDKKYSAIRAERRENMIFFDFNSKESSGYKKLKLVPGDYTSTVKSVDWADGYVKGKAIKISYHLTSKSGSEFEFSEIFWVHGGNRSRDFDKYLNDNRIDNIADFVGCKEKLTLMNDVRNGKVYLNIVDREFIAHGEAGDANGLEV